MFAATARRQIYDPLGRSIGGLLMLAALGAMAAMACGLTIVARLAFLSRMQRQVR